MSMPSPAQDTGLSAPQLRQRYLIALVLIALLTLASQWVVQTSIADQSHDSRVVNIAGRQRMLSQKIAKAAHYIGAAESPAVRHRHLDQLQDALTLWERSHAGLQRGDHELGLPGNNSPQIVALFDSIAPHHSRMIVATRAILAAPDDSEGVRAAIRQLADAEASFLRGMDAIVFRYDSEARARVEFTRQLEFVLATVTLLVLLLEARFIFAPAVRRLRTDMFQRTRHAADLEKLFAVSPAAIFLIDQMTLRISRVNEKAERLMDSAAENLLTRPIADFVDAAIDSNRAFLSKLQAGEPLAEYEVVLVDARQRTLETLVSSCRITVDEHKVYVLGITNITELKDAQKSLQYYATFDELSGLINRRTGLMLLQKEIGRAMRERTTVTLCYVDLDGLKETNDRYGHHEGDWLIRTASSILNESVRDGDIAIRMGGDEFLLVLHDCTEEEAAQLARRIEGQLSEASERDAKPFRLAASFGIVAFNPSRHASPGDAVAEADARMYAAKRQRQAMEPNAATSVETHR